VRLSMGGEPTFLSPSTMWTERNGTPRRSAPISAAMPRPDPPPARPDSRRAACCITGRANATPASSFRAGPFPCTGARNGQSALENDALVDKEVPARPATVDGAERFAATLAQQLGLPPDCAVPAYEDPAHFLLIEQKLPLNLDPATNKARRSAGCAPRSQGVRARLDKPSGYVMPIQVWHSQERGRRWITERLGLRRQALPPRAILPSFRFADRLAALPPRPRTTACRAHRSARRRVHVPARGAAAQPPPSATLPPPPKACAAAGRGGWARWSHRDVAATGRFGVTLYSAAPLHDAEDYAALAATVEDVAARIRRPARAHRGLRAPSDWRSTSSR